MKYFNRLVKILKLYRFHIVKILIFELFFLIRMFKGGEIKINNHKHYSDNIPCPYFFLWKIKNFLVRSKIKSLIDLGCGNGRAIYFLNNYLNINLVGIEYDQETFLTCKKLFEKEKNVEIINDDILSLKFLNKETNCYFLCDPLKNESYFHKLISEITAYNKKIHKKIYFILINVDENKLKIFSKHNLIEHLKINTRGYFIYSNNSNTNL